MSRFMRFMMAVTAVIHVPFVVAVAELLRRMGLASSTGWIVASALGLAGIAAFWGRAEHMMHDRPRPVARMLFVELPYFWHWCACLFCLVPSIVYLVLEPIVDLARGAPVGPGAGFFLWTYIAGLVVCGYGVTLRRWWFYTRRVDIPIRGLARDFDGYTIAHLSDLHIGTFTPLWWAKRWSRVTNDLAPDATVITGDMVTSGTAFHGDIASFVSELRAKDGVFVSMGNHDYFGDGEPLISLLQGSGARVLRNQGLVLARGEGKLYLAAIDDTWTKRADMDAAMAERPEGVPTVLLAHDPDRFVEAEKHGVALTLAGHTHGGQIAVPFFARQVNASKLAHRFHLGLYRLGESLLYVHPGLGTTGPPMRLGVAPAIILYTLRAA